TPMAAGVTPYARVSVGRIAWVANRSTTVRKAVNPITTLRNSTPETCVSISMFVRAGVACAMTDPCLLGKKVTPVIGRHFPFERRSPSHVLVVLVVQHVAHEQHHGLVSEVLPPMGGAASLRPDVALLVHDRYRAIAGIFDDL